jgi:hypothetical protein
VVFTDWLQMGFWCPLRRKAWVFVWIVKVFGGVRVGFMVVGWVEGVMSGFCEGRWVIGDYF